MSDIGPDEIATGSLRNRSSRSSRRVIGARQQGDEDLIRALDHKRRRQIMQLWSPPRIRFRRTLRSRKR